MSALRIFAAVAVVLCHVGCYLTSVRVLRKAGVYGYGSAWYGGTALWQLSCPTSSTKRKLAEKSLWWGRAAFLNAQDPRPYEVVLRCCSSWAAGDDTSRSPDQRRDPIG